MVNFAQVNIWRWQTGPFEEYRKASRWRHRIHGIAMDKFLASDTRAKESLIALGCGIFPGDDAGCSLSAMGIELPGPGNIGVTTRHIPFGLFRQAAVYSRARA